MALVHLSTVEEDMDAEFETIDARLQSFISQFHSEVGVLDRIIHKYKNQHRRSSYFQYLLKVRRDCKLLQTTNLVELVNSSFLVINGNRPKQKLQLLESKSVNEPHKEVAVGRMGNWVGEIWSWNWDWASHVGGRTGGELLDL
ncbi:zinc finger, CCHC-type containing protein [Tanacetum coccineum]